MNPLILTLIGEDRTAWEIVGPFPDDLARQRYIKDHPAPPGFRWILRVMTPPEGK